MHTKYNTGSLIQNNFTVASHVCNGIVLTRKKRFQYLVSLGLIFNHKMMFLTLVCNFAPCDQYVQGLATGGFVFKFDLSKESRLGILPRNAINESQIRWFKIPSCFITHTCKIVQPTSVLKNTCSSFIVPYCVTVKNSCRFSSCQNRGVAID